MKKTFGMIALLASSALALVSPALAHDQQDSYGYRNQNYSNSYTQLNNRTTDENAYRNSYVAGNSYSRGNSHLVTRAKARVNVRDNDRRDREPVGDRQVQRFGEWR